MTGVKLTDRQIAGLADLHVAYPRWRKRGGRRGPRTNTLDSLVELGLAQSRYRYPTLEREYLITGAGRDRMRGLS